MPAWGAVAVCLSLPWAGKWQISRRWLVWPCVIVALVGLGVAGYAAFFSHPLTVAAQVKPEDLSGIAKPKPNINPNPGPQSPEKK